MLCFPCQRDSRSFRFPLPNRIWKYHLKYPAFSVLAYLHYRRHRGLPGKATPEELADALDLKTGVIGSILEELVQQGLITPDLIPVSTNEKFFSLCRMKSSTWTLDALPSPSMPSYSTGRTGRPISARSATRPSDRPSASATTPCASTCWSWKRPGSSPPTAPWCWTPTEKSATVVSATPSYRCKMRWSCITSGNWRHWMPPQNDRG